MQWFWYWRTKDWGSEKLAWSSQEIPGTGPLTSTLDPTNLTKPCLNQNCMKHCFWRRWRRSLPLLLLDGVCTQKFFERTSIVLRSYDKSWGKRDTLKRRKKRDGNGRRQGDRQWKLLWYKTNVITCYQDLFAASESSRLAVWQLALSIFFDTWVTLLGQLLSCIHKYVTTRCAFEVRTLESSTGANFVSRTPRSQTTGCSAERVMIKGT